MEAWLSWTLVLTIGGALYYYYSQNSNRGRQRGRTLQRAANAATPKDVQWSDSEAKSKSTAKAAKPKASRKSAKKTVQEVGDKAGAYLSAASSNAGADADDDLSPVASPALGATTAKAPSGRDVSDMLDPKTSRSVLKINPSEKPARPSKPQQQHSETPVETKKQRQNKKKNEEAKAAREAAEEERKKLLEKQRRTAREARGEPARNGLQPAQAPTSNAWSHSPAQATPTQATPNGGQLLDTLDTASTASSSEAATNGTAPTPDSTSYANLPSEEDQLRMVMEESAWTTVPKGKKQQKKNKTGGETIEEGSDSGAPQEPTPAPVKPAPVKKSESVKPQAASRYEVLSEPTTKVSHPMDSDWPVV